jgi:hypothetical protein
VKKKNKYPIFQKIVQCPTGFRGGVKNATPKAEKSHIGKKIIFRKRNSNISKDSENRVEKFVQNAKSFFSFPIFTKPRRDVENALPKIFEKSEKAIPNFENAIR